MLGYPDIPQASLQQTARKKFINSHLNSLPKADHEVRNSPFVGSDEGLSRHNFRN